MFDKEKTENEVRRIAVNTIKFIATTGDSNAQLYATTALNEIERIYEAANREYAKEQEDAARMVF